MLTAFFSYPFSRYYASIGLHKWEDDWQGKKPPLTGQAVSLIKDSALVSTIAIFDLTMAGQAIISETFLTFEIWFTVALIYLVMTVSISTFVHYLEKRSHYDQ